MGQVDRPHRSVRAIDFTLARPGAQDVSKTCSKSLRSGTCCRRTFTSAPKRGSPLACRALAVHCALPLQMPQLWKQNEAVHDIILPRTRAWMCWDRPRQLRTPHDRLCVTCAALPISLPLICFLFADAVSQMCRARGDECGGRYAEQGPRERRRTGGPLERRRRSESTVR